MNEFSLTREQLKTLVHNRDSDSLSLITEAGGIRGIAKKLQVDPDLGLGSSPANLQVRREIFGLNFVPPAKARSYLSFLKDAFSDMTIIILCVAAIVDLGIAVGYAHTSSSYAESAAILVSICVVTNVAAGNDYRKQSQFRKLNAQVDNLEVVAVRDGQKVQIQQNDVVVGDIVTVSLGDIICADGLLLVCHGVETDESSLTGEPKSIRKSVAENPFMLSGTKVMDGSGSFLVIAVGENSEAGQIRMIVQGGVSSQSNPPAGESIVEEGADLKSVLALKLDLLATRIGKMGTLIATICFVVMVVRFCVTTYVIEDVSGKCAELGAGSICNSSQAFEMNPFGGGPWANCKDASSGGGMTCCLDTPLGAVIQGSPCPWLKVHLGELIRFFITAVTILVVAVPEGLPLAVTLSLAFSVIRMQKDKNLVKHLDACETMGSATVICSDKTGTLTKNRMTVMRAYLSSGESFKPNGQMGVGLSIFGFVESDWLKFELLENGMRKPPPNIPLGPLISLLAENVCVNSTADIQWDSAVRLFTQIGNKTECALLQFVAEFGVEYEEIRCENKSFLVQSFPFNSVKKQSAVILRDSTTGGFRVHIKGASEIVIELCSSVMSRNGEVKKISDEDKKVFSAKISEYANLAMRTIAIAYKSIEDDHPESDWEAGKDGVQTFWEKDLTLLAIVGIEDPLRDEVPEAILKCRRAGVDVRMVTGDNIDTAVAIAKGCGILRSCDLDARGNPKPGSAMTGAEFRQKVLLADGTLNREEFENLICRNLKVLARSSPKDKFTLVSGLCESVDAQVVAVTGDGTNDAPALKRADVGFAMGITGTAVAKEAADIILMDDNFSSIVKAIIWGRNVYESIAKFLQFQLTINIVALVLAIEGAISASKSPLTAVQMLWVNLIMDSLASLALATELPTEDHLNRPPVGRHKSMISSIMKWNIAGHAIYQLAVLNVLLFEGPQIFGFPNGVGSASPSEHNTLIFNTFVLIQLMNQINMRKLHHEWNLFKGLFASRIFLVIFAVEVGVQVLIIEIGGSYFHTQSLSLTSWLVGVVLSLLVFPVQWLIIAVATLANRFPLSMGRKSLAVVPLVPTDKDSSEPVKVTVAMPNQVLLKSKRQEATETMAKGLTKRGDEVAKKRFSQAGHQFQARRKSDTNVLRVV